jgi:predicted SprT family Zn-dependent metalloprotease
MNLFKAEQLAKELMHKHNLRGWSFRFDNARRRFGRCSYSRKLITLSSALVAINDEAKVKDTILHEIAHALVGSGHGHDWVWKTKAIEIGCDGKRCYSSEDIRTPESKYFAICGGCGKTHKKHRKAKYESSCGYCSGGRYNPTFKLEFKLNPNF